MLLTCFLGVFPNRAATTQNDGTNVQADAGHTNAQADAQPSVFVSWRIVLGNHLGELSWGMDWDNSPEASSPLLPVASESEAWLLCFQRPLVRKIALRSIPLCLQRHLVQKIVLRDIVPFECRGS